MPKKRPKSRTPVELAPDDKSYALQSHRKPPRQSALPFHTENQTAKNGRTAIRPAVGADGYCNAERKSGDFCKHKAGHGTDHEGFGACKYHGGASPNSRTKAAVQEADHNLRKYGQPVPTDPGSALMAELARANGAVQYLTYMVNDISPEDILEPKNRVLIAMYQDERNKLMRVARACIDIGLAERQLALAEQLGMIAQRALLATLNELKIPAEERDKVAPLLRSKLIEATAVISAPKDLRKPV